MAKKKRPLVVKNKIIPMEEQIIKAFVQWCRVTRLPKQYGKGKIGDYLFHAPSEGKRTKSFGTNLKEMGWCPGFPDIAIFLPSSNRKFHSFFMEFKSIKGKLTKNQKEWIERLNKFNLVADKINSLDFAINITRVYLGII